MSSSKERESKAKTERFVPKLFSSLAGQLILMFIVALLSTGANYLITQRGDISIVEIGPSAEGYEALVLVDNYSFSPITPIQIGFEATKLVVIDKSQTTKVEAERISSKEQSIRIEKVLPLRRFSVRIATAEPIVQATLQKIEGPVGLRIFRTDRITPPFFFDLLIYMIFVYIPTAAMLSYFSWKLYGHRKELVEQSAELRSRTEALRDELDKTRKDTSSRIAALRRTYLFRMKKFSEENNFWRLFMQKIMRENLKEGTNPKKILGMFFGTQGLLTDKDIEELDEAEIDLLLRDREMPANRTRDVP